jgi:hypothetical protein
MGWGLADLAQDVAPASAAPDVTTMPADVETMTVTAARPAASAPVAAPDKPKPDNSTKWGLADLAQDVAPPTPSPTDAARPPSAQEAPAVPAPAPPPAATDGSPPSSPSWGDLARAFVGSTAATLNGIPRGMAFGTNVPDYLDAATQTPLRMITGMQGPTAAFNEGLARDQDLRKQMSDAYPIASGSGEVGGNLVTGMEMAPALGFKAAQSGAGLLPRMGAAANYVGRNAAAGGAISAISGGDPTTGAAIGAGSTLIGPALSLAAKPIKGAYNTIAPMVSNSAREANIANTLARTTAPSAIETSPVGPLDLAQATGNPAIAGKVRYAQGLDEFSNAVRTLRDQQVQAATDQVGKIAQPATQADASSQFVNAMRNARDLAGQEEGRLWQVPELAQRPIYARPVQQAVYNSMKNMEPGLKAGLTPQIAGAVEALGNMGETVTVRDLNAIRSQLESISRSSLDGSEKAIARRLSSAFMDGMDQVPELGGTPVVPHRFEYTANPNPIPIKAKSTTVSMMGSDPVKQSTRHPPTLVGAVSSIDEAPAIPGDASIAAAYKTARDYTRRMRTMFGEPDAASVLGKNKAGVYRRNPSEGIAPYFNFSNGSPEGAESIAQLSDFIGSLKQQAGSAALSDEIKDSAKSYVAASLMKAARLEEGQKFSPQNAIKFLTKNQGWMQSSGLFDKNQIKAANDLLEYSRLLRRTEALNMQSGSPTNARGETAKTFVDELLSPLMKRTISLGAILGGGSSHGGAGALGGGMAATAFEGMLHKAQDSLREIMGEALFDPRVAKDLMMKASPGNTAFFSPATKRLMTNAKIAIGSSVLPQQVARHSQQPAEMAY